MLGRLSYYLNKGLSDVRTRGPKETVSKIFSFLVRRRFFLGFLAESIEYEIFSRFRSVQNTMLVELYRNDLVVQPRKVLIYVSFDSRSTILNHVTQQLEAFSQLGYSIIFVTTSPRVESYQVDQLRQWCSIILHRKNQGYDFCSWKLGYLQARDWVCMAESVILMNDSCLGPYFDLKPLVQKMEKQKDSVFGVTKSYEITEYIQSYFFHFGSEVIRSGVLEGFFDRIRVLSTKWSIVRFLEIGSSRYFKRRRVPLRALVDPRESTIAAKMKEFKQTEPSAEPLASWLIEQRANPFYKRSNC